MAYLTGLVSSAEVLPVVRQQRDKMLSRVAIGALQVIKLNVHASITLVRQRCKPPVQNLIKSNMPETYLYQAACYPAPRGARRRGARLHTPSLSES